MITQGYEQLWKAIIRPPRAQYKDSDLGPKIFKYHGLRIQRTDIQLTNNKGFKIKCSHYQPYIRPCKLLPCVIYLHGNSSCRLEGRTCIPYILCHDITLFTFDFAGCGNSQGQYISLGYYQKDDVELVFQYLRSLQTVSSIGLWGRSMGAVTALMYADKNPEIACLVCDSPFSNLQKLCKQLAQKFAGGFISFFSGIAMTFISKTIKQKNNFSISDLDPLGKHVKKAYIPAFFIAAKDDNFILPKHSQKLYDAYSGQKKIEIVEGDHNSQRDQSVNDSISIFFYNNLHAHQLIVKDQGYMKQQKQSKQRQRQKIKETEKQKYKQKQKDKYYKDKQNIQQKQKFEMGKNQKIYNNVFLQQLEDQDKMLQMAIRLSLQQSKQQHDGKPYSSEINIEERKQNLIRKDQLKKQKKQNKQSKSVVEQSKDSQKQENKNKNKIGFDLIEFNEENIDQKQLDQSRPL